ncbi:MAG: TauD/TfdA family dioxygenase, partial [Planktomarina sp.]
MGSILTQHISGPEAWVGADFTSDESWIYQLSRENIADIDAALINAAKMGCSFPNIAAIEFALPSMAELFKEIANVLENGRGFVLLRGLPVDRYSDTEINLVYYAIGLHLGQPVGQNPKGDLLGKVMNVGDPQDKNTRVYETNLFLPYHTDPSDVVGLLCLRKAKRGGRSSLVSAASIYNEILDKHPEYLGVYYKQFFYAHLGANRPGLTSLFSFHRGKLACRYLRQYIELGHEIMEQRLSKVEVEALDIFDNIMHRPEFRIDMMLEPGDLQFANNYAVLHSRNDFED